MVLQRSRASADYQLCQPGSPTDASDFPYVRSATPRGTRLTAINVGHVIHKITVSMRSIFARPHWRVDVFGTTGVCSDVGQIAYHQTSVG